MSRTTRTLLLLTTVAATPLAAVEAPDEERAVVEAVERFFHAMAAKDVEAARALSVPEGRWFALRPVDGRPAIRSFSNAEDFAAWPTREAWYLERIWNPEVRVHGRLATLWAPYDFFLDGVFHHCGIDAVDLLRDEDGWKVIGGAYTMEQEGCAPSPLPAPVFDGARAVVPRSEARHLIYLHGRIVQETQSARPESPEYGVYELEAILEALRRHGFVVHDGIRPKGTTLDQGAASLVDEVRRLRAEGVPIERITVVGASMGAAIALRAAARLDEAELRFVLLGACLGASAEDVRSEAGRDLRGRLLAIREASDELSAGCAPWSGDARWRELEIATGLRHGVLYRPLPEWLAPAVEWARTATLAP
jgi:hypothetical protein